MFYAFNKFPLKIFILFFPSFYLFQKLFQNFTMGKTQRKTSFQNTTQASQRRQERYEERERNREITRLQELLTQALNQTGEYYVQVSELRRDLESFARTADDTVRFWKRRHDLYDDAERTINNWSSRYDTLQRNFHQLEQDHDLIHRRMLEYGEQNYALEGRNNRLLDQIGQLSRELETAHGVLQVASRRYGFILRRPSSS